MSFISSLQVGELNTLNSPVISLDSMKLYIIFALERVQGFSQYRPSFEIPALGWITH